ncbi:MAG: PilZ domain-containing protein, partial [Mesorhizobium sp.]
MTNTTQPLENNSSDSRRKHRQRVLKGGSIITGIKNS